ncbi:helix-turn-helix domain-containing protein [Leptospira bandrabouensis]|uniref:helix-turn-helix domain-containing protein n=1 Tax=Leptospira bandrabouensis TaxID=2484903 RepID=UPI00223CF7CB|nr:helix-turn-helix transcriptional regulator [Leptospira bandrabouensis]MCW7459570.1 helix-turn-helix domain-containing protein [Leptospira bandrabouensis]MCW7478412.1 helix-turn-helix domain-containing protein [Leptospira bandrabouensis]MCW7486304.1 helix-turn-helix domain-containing protein [Leptospira bandrabouensis]
MSESEKKYLDISSRFSLFFKAVNITQDDFAKKLGVSRSNISSWQGGKHGISSAAIKAMEHEFKLNPLWLLTGEGDMFKHESTILDERESEEFHLVNVYLHQNMDVFEFIQNLKQEPRKTHGKVKSLLGKLLGLSTKDLERLEAYLDGMRK